MHIRADIHPEKYVILLAIQQYCGTHTLPVCLGSTVKPKPVTCCVILLIVTDVIGYINKWDELLKNHQSWLEACSLYGRGGQTSGAKSPRLLSFVRYDPVFWGTLYGSCFMSSF